jgi:hypothetical protein
MAKTKEFCRHPQRAEAEKEATRLATLMGSSIHQAGANPSIPESRI